jgi:hypothetical protein
MTKQTTFAKEELRCRLEAAGLYLDVAWAGGAAHLRVLGEAIVTMWLAETGDDQWWVMVYRLDRSGPMPFDDACALVRKLVIEAKDSIKGAACR